MFNVSRMLHGGETWTIIEQHVNIQYTKKRIKCIHQAKTPWRLFLWFQYNTCSGNYWMFSLALYREVKLSGINTVRRFYNWLFFLTGGKVPIKLRTKTYNRNRDRIVSTGSPGFLNEEKRRHLKRHRNPPSHKIYKNTCVVNVVILIPIFL